MHIPRPPRLPWSKAGAALALTCALTLAPAALADSVSDQSTENDPPGDTTPCTGITGPTSDQSTENCDGPAPAPTPVDTPAPESLALFAGAFAGLAALRRLRRAR